MSVLVSDKSPMVSIKKIYKFKIFKKTTKFKRYNRGLTRFIINRKKYILRKKRTSYQLMFNLSFFWSKFYMLSRHTNRHSQLLGSLSYSLTLSNIKFTSKSTKKYIDNASSSDYKPSYILTSAKQGLLFNRSLYALKNMNGLRSLYKQTRFGFLLFNNNPDKLDSILNFGVLSDLSNNYVTLPKEINSASMSTYTSLQRRIFLLILGSVKLLRKILVLTTIQRALASTSNSN
jgi:hypothetical protein